MQELQGLFALMLGTHRKFVDPTTAVELLRGAFRSPEEQQVTFKKWLLCHYDGCPEILIPQWHSKT